MPKTSYLDLLCTSNLIHFFETNKFRRWCMPSSIMMMPFTTFVMISIYRDCGILCETRGQHVVSWQSSFIYSQKFSAVFFSYLPFYQMLSVDYVPRSYNPRSYLGFQFGYRSLFFLYGNWKGTWTEYKSVGIYTKKHKNLYNQMRRKLDLSSIKGRCWTVFHYF